MQRQHEQPQDHLSAQPGHETQLTEQGETDPGRNPSISADLHAPGTSGEPHGSPQVHRHTRTDDDPAGVVHLLFGSLEDLLADLDVNGAPEENLVRVERLVRSRTHSVGGTATLGIAITARRMDEILSAWIIVARLSLDPWGQPLSTAEARAVTVRHREAQRVLAAFVVDAGFAVRGGLYLLSEGCYGLNASAAALAASTPDAPDAPNARESAQRKEGEEHA